ncbi:MAG: hypothetical protein ACRDOG_03995 [Gaiellaceae bacterium]
MRPGLKTLLAALLAAALVVPAATAQPGNGNGGNGGGKPSSAGPPSDRGGGGNGGGKPSWAGQGQAKKAEKAAAKAEKAAEKAERGQATAASAKAASAERATSGKPDLANLDELTPEDLEGLNPAWTCKVERALSGDSFAEDNGTNENDANAFGMCVSDEAQERDGVSVEAVEAFCEPAEGEGTPEDAEAALCAEDTESETTESESLADLLGDVSLDDSEDADDSDGDEAGEGSDEPDSILALLRSLF